jgi:hypothetical protein
MICCVAEVGLKSMVKLNCVNLTRHCMLSISEMPNKTVDMSEDMSSPPKLSRLRPDREKFVRISKPPRKFVYVKGASLKDVILPELLDLPPHGLCPNYSKKSQIQEPLLTEPAHNLPYQDLSTGSPMTFYPTMEQFASFDTFVAYMESQGAHKAGIARIVPPKKWTARKAGYEPSEVDIIIDSPVEQNIANTKVQGAFTTIGDRSIPSFTLPEYLRLATSPKYLTPSHSSYEELEELYWQQNQDPSLPSPIYGADVQTSLTDPDQTVFNLSNLPNILSGKI